MIVLHFSVHNEKLFLWGEAPLPSESPPERKPKRAKGLKAAPPSFHPFPYDAGAKGLISALKEAGFSFRFPKGSTQVVLAWLPTRDNKPSASSPMIHEPPNSGVNLIPAPWKVTALCLTTEQAVELLSLCNGKKTLASGVIPGKDLIFWVDAMRFSGALVARQQFLPGLIKKEDQYLAQWQPLFSGVDRDRLNQLAQVMPAVSRALVYLKEPQDVSLAGPPASSSVSVISSFLYQMVDHFVRSSMEASQMSRRSGFPETYDSLHDLWLKGLRSTDRMLEGKAAELENLSAQVQEWQRPISAATGAPVRLCFRLEEPEGDGGQSAPLKREQSSWFVRYMLQGIQDPSLLIPAKEVWKGNGGLTASALSYFNKEFNSREHLLLSLGQAAGICPRIEASLKKSIPPGYKLDSAGAHEFLTERAMALEQAGFGVLLPAWWTRKGTKLRLSARANVRSPKLQGKSGLSLDALVQFDWEVALGEEKLSFEDLQALAALKVPLVKVRGQWVEVNAADIQEALDFWQKKRSGRVSVREIVQMALGAGKTPGDMAFAGVNAQGWVADFLAELDGRSPYQELAAPQGFQGELRPYQVRGYSWLGFLRRWGLGACLADDMGLGKTIQTLALLQRDRESGGREPVLLICPTSIVHNWEKEASRFTPELPVMIHHGIAREKGERFKEKALKQAVVISSYGLLHRDFDVLKEVPWSGVILDEAQNIKNPETKQARAARALKADFRLALTGTPVENHVGDLWSVIEFLNPGFLGNQAEFKRTFFIPIQAGRDPEAMERLKRLTGPFILRRLKTDKSIISDLPEKMEMKVFCTLTKEQASLYEAVVKETMSSLKSAEGIQRKGLVLATLSKLKQVCNHPAQFLGDNSSIPGRSGKLTRLIEMFEEMIEVGDRALIFTQFAEMGEILRRHLQETYGREALFLHGAVPRAQRDRMVERFQAGEEDLPIFILSLKAGGTGLNLTGANHVFHFDRWWNPAVENQATDRAFRIGQTRNVQVHKFICAGTLEEKIDEMIARKRGIAEKVIGTGEGWLTELSTAEIKNLFALRKEAVGEI